MRTLVIAAFVAIAAPVAAQSAQTGDWTARTNDSNWSRIAGERLVHIELHPEGNRRNQWGFTLKRSEIAGFPDADGYSGDARFALKRDAGTFDFEGTFRNGHGVGGYRFTESPDYVASMRKLGIADVESESPIKMAIHDVSRSFVEGVRQSGARNTDKLSIDDLVKMRIHGVTPDFIRQTRELGFKDLSIDDLVKMRIHGVSPAFVKEMRDLGFKDLTLEQAVKLRIHGVTPAFVKEIRGLGYTELGLDDFVKMRIHGVTPTYIREMKDLGIGNVKADRLVAFRIHGVTPQFVRDVRDAGFKNLDADELVEFAIHGRRFLKKLDKAKG